MKKKLILFLGALSGLIIVPIKTYAFCPVCMVATGFLAVFLKKLGVDEVIFGIWLGAFTLSAAVVSDDYIKNKVKNFPFRRLAVIFVFYASSIASLYWSNSISAYSRMWGVNKMLLGIASGSLMMLLAAGINKIMKEANGGKVFVPYQKIILAILVLSINSLVFYLLIK